MNRGIALEFSALESPRPVPVSVEIGPLPQIAPKKHCVQGPRLWRCRVNGGAAEDRSGNGAECRRVSVVLGGVIDVIDIGNTAHFVAMPPDRDDAPVRDFPGFAVHLNAIAGWLKANRVDTVAMESSGVKWIPLYELLESRGFTMLLVNARHRSRRTGWPSAGLDEKRAHPRQCR